jgi:uncharacterized membrane protein YesL
MSRAKGGTTLAENTIYKPKLYKLIAEWVSLLWQHLGAVVILSAVGFFGSVPIITGGIILIGIYNCTKGLVRKELVLLREDFTSAIKEKWKTATALFLLLLVAILIIAFDLWFFWSFTVKAFFWVGLWFAVLFLMGAIYMFPMLADQNIGLKKIITRSFYMAFVDPLFSFLIALTSLIWIALCIVIIPMLATLCLAGLGLWTSIAYREMSLKVDSILAQKEQQEGDQN